MITGVLVLATSGWLWRGDAARHAEIRAEKATLEDSAKRIHDELVQTNLKYRGFQASLGTMPDTVQRYGGKKYMAIGEGYRKTVRKLEFKERDVTLEIKALDREATRARQQARSRALPAAVAGASATVIGAILMVVSRRRVGA